MSLEPAKIADFRIAGAIGSGTTAKVYEAVHHATGRPVAIKVLEPSQSGSEMRERFAREALLLAGVSSRHVGRIEGFGFDRGQPFLVLERLKGETLDAKLRRDGPVPLPIAMRWIEQLIIGVRDCHHAQVIHRDIKPSNVYLHHDGFDEVVKLIDFGVARLREIAGEAMGGITSANHLIGSMGYMAPEQFHDAKNVGFTADLYAIGVVIYRTLTGRLPFVNRSIEAVLRMKTEQDPPPVSSTPGMPMNERLDWFVRKAMARAAEERFQSAREMLEQWWNVMGALEDETATDVMRGMHGLQASVGATLRRSMSDVNEPPIEFVTVPDDMDEERTIRRPPRSSMPPLPAPNGSPLGTDSFDPAIPISVAAPETVPGHAPVAITFDDRITFPAPDPFDVPTKADPNLRKLVERELELQKQRKRR